MRWLPWRRRRPVPPPPPADPLALPQWSLDTARALRDGALQGAGAGRAGAVVADAVADGVSAVETLAGAAGQLAAVLVEIEQALQVDLGGWWEIAALELAVRR